MTRYIGFEGIDGSGKSSQVERVFAHYLALGTRVEKRGYPVYSSFFGTSIGEFLSHDAARPMPDAKSAALWYALDRWLDFTRSRDAFADSEIVLLNRYTLSSVVYQSLRTSNVREMQAWVEELEHQVMGLPRPDLYLVFDVPPTVARTNVHKKGHRDYVGSRLDVLEEDTALQARAADVYLELAAAMSNARVIQCHAGGRLLSEQAVLDRVLAVLGEEGLL